VNVEVEPAGEQREGSLRGEMRRGWHGVQHGHGTTQGWARGQISGRCERHPLSVAGGPASTRGSSRGHGMAAGMDS
jgi:hypothetical protein